VIVVSPVFPQAAFNAGYPLSRAFMLPVAVLHLVLVLALFPVQPVPTWIYPEELVTFAFAGEASNASAISASPCLVTIL
jgi:hypothetical protein